MAEAQYSSNDENQNQNSNKNIKNVPVMQNTIKENPNNTALDEDEIDFYFTQREVIFNIYIYIYFFFYFNLLLFFFILKYILNDF